MGLIAPFLFLFAVPAAVCSIRCAACVDRLIEYNHDMIEVLLERVPFGMPNCTPFRKPKNDPEIPREIWLVPCENSCISFNWTRHGKTDLLRHCSTGLLKDGENSNANMKYPVVGFRRYPGLEISMEICNEDLCNYDEDVVSEAYEYATTTEASNTSSTVTVITTAGNAPTTTSATSSSTLANDSITDTTSTSVATQVPVATTEQISGITSTFQPTTIQKPKPTPKIIGRSISHLSSRGVKYGLMCIIAMVAVIL